MNTPTDPKAIVSNKLLRLAQLTTLCEQIGSEQQSKVEAIKRAASEVMAPTLKEMEELEKEIKALALKHKEELFPKVRSLACQGHVVKLTKTTVYEADDDEGTITLLEELRDSTDPEKEKDRIAAAACLNVKTTVNKTFIRSNWKQFAPWFQQIIGFQKIETDSVSIKLSLSPTCEA